MSERLLVLIAVGLTLPACGNELELSAGTTDAGARQVVAVGTRPVCGNGVVEPGEECDDGNGVETDGCDGRCQAPCAADALAVLGCGAGRSFTDRVELYSNSRMEWVTAEAGRTTQVCRTEDGQTFEVAVCRNGNCLNILPPLDGGHLCSAPCVATPDCPLGQVCVETWVDGPAVDQPLELRRDAGPQPTGTGQCLAAVGGGVGDRCGTCGAGLNCNEVAGLDNQFLCMPSCEVDDDCPGGSICSNAYSVHTGDPNGRSCFHAVNTPVGSLVDDATLCARSLSLPAEVVLGVCREACTQVYVECGQCFEDADGACQTQLWCRDSCLAGGNWDFFACLADQRSCGGLEACSDAAASGRRYCTRNCQRDEDCPATWQCLDFGEAVGRLCVANSRASLTESTEFVLVPERVFPHPECAADIDDTCTFESDCDPDCLRTLGCGDVPAAGRCREDGSVVFCAQHQTVSIDCVARGLGCGFDEARARFDCLAAAPAADAGVAP